jgi:hypothetical protein
MELVDPDTYVNWQRTDDPGQNPRWESKCGCIIQTKSGNEEQYWGFHWPDATNKKYAPIAKGIYYTTFGKAKRRIERKYFELHPEENVPAY